MKFDKIQNNAELELYIVFVNSLIDEDCKRGLTDFEANILDQLGDLIFQYEELECEKYLS